MINKFKLGLLPRIVVAMALGILFGLLLPAGISRIFLTFNAIFSSFLSFIIPLLILGLIVPGIADVGRNAGRLLLLTSALAYLFTLLSGFLTYGVSTVIYPWMLHGDSLHSVDSVAQTLQPYFTIDIPPLFGVMSALITAFVVGIGITIVNGIRLKDMFGEFRDIINLVITRVIIPLLPLYIFGIFLSMTISDQVGGVLSVFIKLILMIFVLTAILLFIQFTIAGIVAKRNPLTMLRRMMVAYVTALGTQSSAATIPVTLEQTIKNGVRPAIAGFVIPLCATIHLSGSTMKIVACALAIMMLGGNEVEFASVSGFIMILGITMIAAPGVPGGAIMAALGVLESMLKFDEPTLGLMIALYIAMDSFGTATNVTGDGAIAVIIDKVASESYSTEKV